MGMGTDMEKIKTPNLTILHSQNRNWINTPTDLFIVIGIFLSAFINSYVFFKSPFEFYFGYLIYLILLPYQIRKFGINKILLQIFIILFINGIIMIILGYNSSSQFFKVYLGLLMAYIFYDNVIRMFDFDVVTIFKWYLKAGLIVSYIGLFQLISWKIGFEKGYNLFGIFNKWGISPGGFAGIRINAVFSEPTYYGAFMAGAFFAAIYTLLPIKKNIQQLYKKHEALLVIFIYLMTSSGLAQNGVLLSIIILLFHFGLIRYMIVFIPIIILSFNIAYKYSNDFRERIDSLIELYLYDRFELGKTHGSSFILYNNYHVSTENFFNNPLFGTGIGSHPIAFEKYSRGKEIKVYGFQNNSADANSMLLRLISETGLFGTLLFLYLTFKCFVKRMENISDYYWVISSSFLLIILLNLFRQGHYFYCGFPLYFLGYIYNKLNYKNLLYDKNSFNPGTKNLISTTGEIM
jgi:hypothetical protein